MGLGSSSWGSCPYMLKKCVSTWFVGFIVFSRLVACSCRRFRLLRFVVGEICCLIPVVLVCRVSSCVLRSLRCLSVVVPNLFDRSYDLSAYLLVL